MDGQNVILNLIIPVNDDHGRQTRYTDPMSAQCWASVADDGFSIQPALGQRIVFTRYGRVELLVEMTPIFSSL